jgi:hypothetical protein
MNIEIANAMYGYFETLYVMNQKAEIKNILQDNIEKQK